MKIHRISLYLSQVAKLNAFVLTLIFNAITLPTYANDPQNSSQAVPTALAPASVSQLFLAVHPAVGKPNQPRAVFLQLGASGCSDFAMSFDTSLMESQNLVVIRTRTLSGGCIGQPPARLARFDLEFTPTKTGTLTLRWDKGGPDVTIESVADSIASRFDVNGMWFDAATNGSGIAVHHNRSTTDVAFGTWFLFNNNGESRWYTLQSANWRQDGSVLEGLLIQVAGTCPAASLAACPALGAIGFGPSPATKYGVMPALTRITFQSSTRARVEVLTLSGTAIFTSELTKLLF